MKLRFYHLPWRKGAIGGSTQEPMFVVRYYCEKK